MLNKLFTTRIYLRPCPTCQELAICVAKWNLSSPDEIKTKLLCTCCDTEAEGKTVATRINGNPANTLGLRARADQLVGIAYTSPLCSRFPVPPEEYRP